MATPTIASNSPSAGHISWSDFVIRYQGVDYSVDAASTNDRWVWWVYNGGAPIIQAGATIPTNLTDDDLILFSNNNGIALRIQSTDLIDGELIVDGSIFADAIAANQIASAHIITAGLDAGVIKFGLMSGDRISVNTLLGDRIVANSLSVAKLAVASLDNIIEDPGFINPMGVVTAGSFWQGSTAASIAAGAGQNGANAMQFVAADGAAKVIFGPLFPTSEKKYFRGGYWIRSSVALPANSFYMQLRSVRADGTTGLSSLLYCPAIAANTWTLVTGMLKTADLPEDAVRADIRFTVTSVAPVGASIKLDAYPSLTRANAGELTVDGTILAQHIAADTITANEIATDTITANEIATDTITANEIAANTITANEIAADTITANEIAANAITANEIAADAVTASEIAANTITANEIAANAITAAEIAADAVTASEIAANTITANEIAANTITAAEIAADAITASEIAAGAVTADEIAANAIIAAKIASNQIGTRHLVVGGENRASDPGFESGTFDYHAITTTATLVRGHHPTVKRSGTKALTHTIGVALTVGTQAILTGGSSTDPANHPMVKPGDVWRAGIWARCNVGSALKLRVSILYRKLSDPTVAYVSSVSPAGFVQLTNQWQYISHEFLYPANAGEDGFVMGQFVVNDGAVGDIVYYDDMDLTKRYDGSLIVDGTIVGEKINATLLITGKTIKGGTILGSSIQTSQTANSGPRMEINEDVDGGFIKGYIDSTGIATYAPTKINPRVLNTGNARRQSLYLSAGAMGGGVGSIDIISGSIDSATPARVIIDGETHFPRVVEFEANAKVMSTQNFIIDRYVGGGGTGANINDSGAIIRTGSRRDMKEEIVVLSLEEALKVLKMEAVSFKWRPEQKMGRARQAGFIAEQTAEVGAELWVTRDKDGDPSGVRYAEITAAHNVIVADQARRLDTLEGLVGRIADRFKIK